MFRVLCVFSLLFMLQRAALAEPDPTPAATPAAAPTTDADDDTLPPRHEPVKMRIGIADNGLEKLDLGVGTFNAEFVVTVKCDREPCKPELDVLNGKLTGKPEKVHDDKLFKKFKMKAELSRGDRSRRSDPFDFATQAPDHPVRQGRSGSDHVRDRGRSDAHAHRGGTEPHQAARLGSDDRGGADVETEERRRRRQGVILVYFNVNIHRPLLASFTKGLVPILLLLAVAGSSS